MIPNIDKRSWDVDFSSTVNVEFDADKEPSEEEIIQKACAALRARIGSDSIGENVTDINEYIP